MFGKQKIAAVVAEFLGTGVLTFLYLSVHFSSVALAFFVGAAVGLTLTLLIFVFGKASGGFFNPAITLAFALVRKLQPLRAAIYVVAQLLGAWAAYALFTYFAKQSLPEATADYDGHVLAAEAAGTALFAFGVAAAVYQGFSRAVTASFAGLALMLGVIAGSAVNVGMGLLNPAVALGGRAWEVFGSAGWATYVLGPVLGAAGAVLLYHYLFADNEVATAKVAATGAPVATAKAAKAAKPAAKKKAPAKKKTTTRKKK